MLLKVAGKGPTKRLMYGTIKQQADASRQKNRQSADARRQAPFKQTRRWPCCATARNGHAAGTGSY